MTILAICLAVTLGIILRERHLRRALREARAVGDDLRLAIDTIPTIVWITEPDGTVTFMNRAWREFTGLSLRDVAQGRWIDTLHPDEAQRVQATRNEAVAAGRPYELDARLRQADGTYRWVLRRARPLRNERGEIVKWFGVGTDIHDLKRAQRAARRARERALTAEFSAALEERSRLAREIHDTLLQGFAGVALQLAALSRRLTDITAVTSLSEVLGLAQRTLDEARLAVWDLREPAAESESFAASLREVAEHAIGQSGLLLDFEVRGTERPIDLKLQSVATRVLRECIANTIRHAQARSVRVLLGFGARNLRLRVADDGQGFAVDPTFRGYGKHWGLLGMSERAADVGGGFTVQSSPGAGTRAALRLPISPNGELLRETRQRFVRA